MKKFFSVMLAIAMLFCVSFSVMATNVEFVPSITNKGAPEIVITIDDDGNLIGGIYDADGNLLSKEYEDCIVITSVSDADKSKDIPKKAKEILKDAYEELNEKGSKLSELCPELNDIVKEKFGDDYDADDLVVRDLFDVTSQCDNIDKYLNGGDNTFEITFKLPLSASEFVTAMVYVDGEWKVVPKVVNNGNGTVTVSFNEICPVAFLVPGDSIGETSVPATGDAFYSDVILWGSLMAVSLAGIVVVLVSLSRRRKKN